MKTKEEILSKHIPYLAPDLKLNEDILKTMQEYADQEVKKDRILFINWLSKEIKTDRLMQEFETYKNQVNE